MYGRFDTKDLKAVTTCPTSLLVLNVKVEANSYFQENMTLKFIE